MEAICARLCLLTRAAWREGLPAPMTRPMVRRMLRVGALSDLTLRRTDEVRDEHYARAEALLSRSAEIYHLVEAVRAQGYDVLLPEDEEWPVNLHALGAQMPQFLFVRGHRALLSRRCAAVAGSRTIGGHAARLAGACGEALAREGLAMVCGGAWGVDAAAQHGLLDHGGSLILVPAFPAAELLRQAYLRDALAQGRLLLVCDTWPEEPFSAQKALSRNHTIYALGDAAVVIAARAEKGGTWSGASACLRGGYTPLFALREDGADFEGNRLLLARGARPLDLCGPVGPQLFGSGVKASCR
ncbi:MAG: DNA-processing protein DprA [Candidatus Ventricola sp.]